MIKVLLLPIWLPFKILWEIAEHSSHHRHHRRRPRRGPVQRTITYTPAQPRSPRPPRPARPSRWQSLPRGRKALIISSVSVVLLVIVLPVALGGSNSPRRSGSPAASTVATVGAQAAQAVPALTPTPTPTPAHRHHKHHHRRHHRVVVPPSAPAPTPAGCYPIASSGNCYEPGEFCPHADAGMTGMAGDGERIVCADNNGLRWEPA